MDALTDPSVERVTLIKSSRIGYTKIINWSIGYQIDQDPAPMLVVQPTIDDAMGYSKDEIAPMIRDVECLFNKVSDSKSRDSANTITKKNFPGGVLTLIGANSARGFRRITVRNVYFDEVDGYPPTAGHEGDQIQLGIKRTDTFWNRKIVIGSTPTIKDFSRVEDSFNESDQRYYFVPCPFCGHFQRLFWKRITKDDPENVCYICEVCEKSIPHTLKRQMVDKGEWRASKPFKGHAGFHIWAAYSLAPHAAWPLLVRDWNNIKNNPEKLKTFINTVLGETWEERGDTVSDISLSSRERETTDETISNQILVITAGVDVQDNRLEAEVVGWGIGEESWSVDYYIFYGDPEQKEVWSQLEDTILTMPFIREDGIELKIGAACIDSGSHTHAVYRFCVPRQGRKVFAVKGSSTASAPLVGRPSKRSFQKGLLLMPIGTDTAKDTIYSWLKITEPGPGFCHFPEHYDEEYFLQLTSEKVVTKYIKGVKHRAWVKKRTENHALDCRVYALAALNILNPNLLRLQSQQARLAESKRLNLNPPPQKTLGGRRIRSMGLVK